MEAHLGEKLSAKIAGRILLRHAGLTDVQREAMAVKYNSMMTFEQAANALRPLDRPDALVTKVSKNYATVASVPENAEDDDQCGDDENEDELQPDDDDLELSGPESDGNGGMNYLLFNPDQEYDEEEAAFIWAYNSAYKDIRRDLQARRKGRQFFKPKPTGVMRERQAEGKQGQLQGQGHRPVWSRPIQRARTQRFSRRAVGKDTMFFMRPVGPYVQGVPQQKAVSTPRTFSFAMEALEVKTGSMQQDPSLSTSPRTRRNSSQCLLEFRLWEMKQWWIPLQKKQ